MMFRWMFIFVFYFLHHCLAQSEDADPNGYLMFCPCMGRFGNQAEQFLGVLNFAKTLNRTLVLPHWIEYPTGNPTSIRIPFERYFKVEPLTQYLRVILMKDFMTRFSQTLWPKGKRYVFCYSPQPNDKDSKESCNAKQGNPFGPYWSHFDIDFDGDVFYQPLYFEIQTPDEWNKRFPVEQYPVLAFSGPPGGFPADPRNIPLAKYLHYSDYIREKAENFLKHQVIDPETMLALHIRNGVDFERACTFVTDKANFFASAQCLGYNLEKGIRLTNDICYPSEEKILAQTGKKIKKVKPSVIFVAADGNPMLDKFRRQFAKKFNLRVVKYDRPASQSEGEAAHLDLYLLSVAQHAIVNCPSSFSAFAKRQRDNQGKSTDFWGVVENEQRNTEL